ncbi:NAD dependent epimerase/dehydratase family protein [Draconibacterium orientale]|uniref:Epimerase n=1 Tax=Draconibacterium orientale TaxID=1168034 RepID=X5DEH7_9BACT|nr:NAD-dependent epimerase/dehydratase family protein [Draconibacterium orientale]AHW59429.1 epimerase [Draconibacterium orientale]SET27174.1 NAD dependent epimerase/dehydratase family protein [Draconibacterium orientale]
MNVIITGATGMVGKGVLLECLDHESVEKVLVIGRNPVHISHPKLEELIHNDFSDFSTVKEQLAGYDACFQCMGISSVGMKENDFKRVTYDYTLALARELLPLNPKMTITYVSGEGTDSSEKGRVMWARVKGKTENDLIKLGFKQAFMFRPGLIIPLRGIKSRTKAYQFVYDYFMWLVRLFKAVAPNAVVNTTQLGKAMINAALYGYNSAIIKPKDIIQLAE